MTIKSLRSDLRNFKKQHYPSWLVPKKRGVATIFSYLSYLKRSLCSSAICLLKLLSVIKAQLNLKINLIRSNILPLDTKFLCNRDNVVPLNALKAFAIYFLNI
jgi:hypothetical protein